MKKEKSNPRFSMWSFSNVDSDNWSGLVGENDTVKEHLKH